MYEENRRTVKLLFGEPVHHEDLGFSERASRRNAFFKPDSLFALELWAANDYGTTTWMVYVLRSVWPGEAAHRVPQVVPGAEVLLKARGKGRVRKTLDWLERLQHDVEDLSRLPRDYFRSAHYSLRNGLEPRPPFEPHGPVLDYLKKA